MEPKVTGTAIKGLIIGLIIIVISVSNFFITGNPDNPVKYLVYAVFFGGIIFSIYQYGKEIHYNSTFGNYFSHGFKISALITLMMIAFIVIFMLSFPEFKEKILELMKKGIESQKDITSDQAEKGMEMYKKGFWLIMIGGALISYLFMGAIASLIGAAITKKQPRLMEDIDQIGK
jgi:hypothetical protein